MPSSYPILTLASESRRTGCSLNRNCKMKNSAPSHTCVLLALVFVSLFVNSAKLVAEQQSKQAVNVVVICDDAVAQKTIRESVLAQFRPLEDLEVVDKNGFSSLILYAEKTINDPKNPNGYAIAVAHTNCYELKLAYQNLKGINDEKVRAVRTVAERALREDTGILRHLNVAHLDELSGKKLDDFSKRIVSDFRDRQKDRD
jgi:hypothetical protein